MRWLHLVKLAITALLVTTSSCTRQTTATNSNIPQPLFSSNDPRGVYAADPNDSWNRIFRLLFTRTYKVRMSSDFPEGAPFVAFKHAMALPSLNISRATFERTEIGDRAIDPLYPSFFTGAGYKQILTDSAFAEFKQALTDSLNEPKTRPPLARALMQSDLGAAFDSIFFFYPKEATAGYLPEREQQLLRLLRQLIKKLALTSEEIASLRSNYADAATTKNLPDVFSSRAGWFEIELLSRRLHDNSAGFRRAARVFIKPRKTPSDPAAFVESLKYHEHLEDVEAVGLVVQNLLLNNREQIVPSPIISEAQFRFFKDNKGAKPVDAFVKQYELSRRLLLTETGSGGFVELNEKSAAYLTQSGNDYSFMSPIREADAPVLVPLRTRCMQCHFKSLTTMMTYSIHYVPPVPTVKILNVAMNDRALYVATQKALREDYRSLLSP